MIEQGVVCLKNWQQLNKSRLKSMCEGSKSWLPKLGRYQRSNSWVIFLEVFGQNYAARYAFMISKAIELARDLEEDFRLTQKLGGSRF